MIGKILKWFMVGKLAAWWKRRAEERAQQNPAQAQPARDDDKA